MILLGICAGDDIELAQRLAFKACKLRLWDARSDRLKSCSPGSLRIAVIQRWAHCHSSLIKVGLRIQNSNESLDSLDTCW